MKPLPDRHRILPLGLTHASPVAELHLQSWQQAYAPIFGAEQVAKLSLPQFEQLWQERLSTADKHYLGLWQEKELLGFSGWGPEQPPGVAEIYHFYLHPRTWGKGVVAPFMQGVLQELQARGYRQVRLWTLAENHRAKKFYANWGFIPTGQRQERTRWGFLLEEVQLLKSFS